LRSHTLALFFPSLLSTMSSDSAAAMSLDEPSTAPSFIKLSSKDGREFTIDRKHALLSALISTSLENDSTASDIPMPGVKGDILAQVVHYLQHHQVSVLLFMRCAGSGTLPVYTRVADRMYVCALVFFPSLGEQAGSH
jgi:hypothetical protein